MKMNLNVMALLQEMIYVKQRMGVHIINLHEYESVGIHWIVLFVNDNNVIYFDSSAVERISKEIRKK